MTWELPEFRGNRARSAQAQTDSRNTRHVPETMILGFECHAIMPDARMTHHDSDGDGISAAVEFALGLNPALRDAAKVRSGMKNPGTGPEFELAYPIRLPVSARYSLAPAWSPDLASPFLPYSVLPQTGSDGLARARLPVSSGTGFLRLQTTVQP
jgi:hypothetical protein